MKNPTKESIARWNRKDAPRKQIQDVTESCRVFLENFGTEDMVGYARAVYLRYATREGIAADYAAISSIDDVYRFLNKHDGPVADNGLDIAELEEAFKQGLISKSTFEEMRGWLKERQQ